MVKQEDTYKKLRPVGPTPEEEMCHCQDESPIALQDHMSAVPLSCMKCNGEVPPERLGFGALISEAVAFWLGVHRSLYLLWLDSGDYEAWARDQLLNPEGEVNHRGLEVVEGLNEFRRTFLWWFQDNSAEDFAPIAMCPRCRSALSKHLGFEVCDRCSILVPN